MRLRPDGSPDEAFARNLEHGFATRRNDRQPAITALATLPDDRLLVGGTFSRLNDQIGYRLVVLQADGRTDDTYPSGRDRGLFRFEPGLSGIIQRWLDYR